MPAPIAIHHTPLSLEGGQHGSGGTTQAAQWAVERVYYVGRQAADPGQEPCGAFLSGVEGASSVSEVAAWMRSEVMHNERRNGRIGEQIIASFPADFDRSQRVATVERFAADVTDGGKIPWFGGIHDLGADARHSHAHMVFRHRLSAHERAALKANGQRVVKGQTKLGWLSKAPTRDSPGSTERFRSSWAAACNAVAAEAGSRLRVEHRSVARQIAGDDAPRHRPTPHERAQYALARCEAKGRAITEHATTRLDAAVAAGRLMPLEAAERRFQVQERVREAASVARQRLHAAIDPQSRLKRG